VGDLSAGPRGPDAAREVLDHARCGARIEAARALDAVDRPDATPEMIRSAAEALRDAAERTAAIAAITRSGAAPAWAGGPIAAYAARLAEAVRKGPDEPLTAIFKPLTGPLTLSFTFVNDYHRCPRCCYLRHVLHFPEPERRPQLVGQTVHKALAAFAGGAMAAEAEGKARPSLGDLLELGRAEFAGNAGTSDDEVQLEHVLAQLRLWHERLYDAGAEVELVEQFFRFLYPHAGAGGEAVVHSFTARIDRLDRLPGAGTGHRIVDYKTGKASKTLLEPRPDDLQLGIYAMALRGHQDGGSAGATEADLLRPALGIAEYHVLSTGERGRLGLAEIDYAKVKRRIDEAITGMLSGTFPRGTQCWDLCRIVV
jgi:RecB family exonuclease